MFKSINLDRSLDVMFGNKCIPIANCWLPNLKQKIVGASHFAEEAINPTPAIDSKSCVVNSLNWLAFAWVIKLS